MPFDEWIARRYDTLWPELFEPGLIEATVDFLASSTGDRPVLEFAIGTGRIALPLSRRGIDVHGIELSPAMVAELRRRPGGPDLRVTVGDLSTATAGTGFSLVYLLRNTITNLTTQDAQVAAFRNAAAHLAPGGCFVIENYIPEPQRPARVFTTTPTHVGYEEYDVAAQIAVSHHHWAIDGELRSFSSPHRYVWPSELDLMARMAGMSLHERWSGWRREPFTGDSRNHISVWRQSSHSRPGSRVVTS